MLAQVDRGRRHGIAWHGIALQMRHIFGSAPDLNKMFSPAAMSFGKPLLMLALRSAFADDTSEPEFVEDDDAALEEALAAAKRAENAEQNVMSDIEVCPHSFNLQSPRLHSLARAAHFEADPLSAHYASCRNDVAARADDLLGSGGAAAAARAARLARQPR